MQCVIPIDNYNKDCPPGTPGSGWVLTSGFTFDIIITHNMAIRNCWARTEFEQREERQEYFGTVVFRLYDEVVPIMVWNFQELCTGQNGFGYECSLIRRVILSFIIRGGGFSNTYIVR